MKIAANPLITRNFNSQVESNNDVNELGYVRRKIKHVQHVLGNYATIVQAGLDQISLHDNDKLVGDAKDHRTDSRHHWLMVHPEKMNCIDLIETCCDVVSVALEKGGDAEVPLRDDIFDNVIIRSIIENTCSLLNSNVRVSFFRASTYE